MTRDADASPIPVGNLVPPVPITAPAEVRSVLAALGRAEDVRVSPDGRRLAIAGFARNTIVLAGLDVRPAGAEGIGDVRLDAAVSLRGAGIAEPHGVDFLDDTTIVVASRATGVRAYRLPTAGGPCLDLVPCAPDVTAAFGGLRQPGSVRVLPGPDGTAEVVVCDNLGGTIVATTARRSDDDWTATGSHVLLRRWLDVPDGVAASPDGRWLAVSNHVTQSVLVYDRTAPLDERTRPIGVLRGVTFPHGLQFTRDGARLLVADAGAPCIHVFAPDDDGWIGVREPDAVHRVMDDDTFRRGRHRAEEGGPKGLDLDRSGDVVVVTSEVRPLAFFAVSPLLDPAEPPSPGELVDRRLGYEYAVLEHNSSRHRWVADAERRVADAERRARAAEAWALGQTERLRAHGAEREPR